MASIWSLLVHHLQNIIKTFFNQLQDTFTHRNTPTMAGDALPVTWDQFEQFVKRFNDMEDKIKGIQIEPTQTPPSDAISTEHIPYIVQHYYLPHSNRASEALPAESPCNPRSSNRPGPPETTVRDGILQKSSSTSRPDSANVSQQQRSAGPRILAAIDDELRPVLVPGALTDLRTGRPRLMIPNGLPRAFKGRFNLSYEGPVEGIDGHWEYFSEGPPGETSNGSAEEMAHTNLGGQSHWTPDKSQPSADDVFALRELLRRTDADDVTEGIDIGWVPDRNLAKEQRDKLLKSLSSDQENDKRQVGQATANPSIAAGVKNAVNNLSNSADPTPTPNDATNDQNGERRSSWLWDPTPELKKSMGMDINPEKNLAAIIEQRTRGGGKSSVSSAPPPSKQSSRRSTRQPSVATKQAHPGKASELTKQAASGRHSARKETIVLASKTDKDATVEKTKGMCVFVPLTTLSPQSLIIQSSQSSLSIWRYCR